MDAQSLAQLHVLFRVHGPDPEPAAGIQPALDGPGMPADVVDAGPGQPTSQSSRIRSPSSCAAFMTLATAPPVMAPRPSSSRISSTLMSSTSWQMDSAGTDLSRCFTASGLKLMKDTVMLSSIEVAASQPSAAQHLQHPVFQPELVGAGVLEFNGQPDVAAGCPEDVQQLRQGQELRRTCRRTSAESGRPSRRKNPAAAAPPGSGRPPDRCRPRCGPGSRHGAGRRAGPG